MDKPTTKNDQINIYPLNPDNESHGWAADIKIIGQEWMRLGCFSEKETAHKRALEAVNE